jgi:hypothetical protein
MVTLLRTLDVELWLRSLQAHGVLVGNTTTATLSGDLFDEKKVLAEPRQ